MSSTEDSRDSSPRRTRRRRRARCSPSRRAPRSCRCSTRRSPTSRSPTCTPTSRASRSATSRGSSRSTRSRSPRCWRPAGASPTSSAAARCWRAGVALFTIMSLACAVAPSVGVLLVARGLQGVGRRGDDPRVAGRRPGRHAARAARRGDRRVERRERRGRRGRARAGRRAGRRRGLALGVPHQRPARARAAGGDVAAADRRRGAAGRAPDVVGHGAAGRRRRPARRSASARAPRGAGARRPPWPHWPAASSASAAALARSARHPAPAVETTLWRSRTFAWPTSGRLLYGAALFPWMLTGVLFLTQVWDYSPLRAGLAVTPGAVTAALVALRAGPLVARVGPRPVVVGGRGAHGGRRACGSCSRSARAPDFLGAVAADGRARRDGHGRGDDRPVERRGAVGRAAALRRGASA